MALHLPPTYLLHIHIPLDMLHELEEQIPTLTYDITEAKLILGKVTTNQRAQFELRSHQLWTEEVVPNPNLYTNRYPGKEVNSDVPREKRRRIDNSPTKEPITIDSSPEPEPSHNLRSKRGNTKERGHGQPQE